MEDKKHLKLGMVILLVNDLEKARNFYKKIGCTEKFSLKNHWSEMTLGDIKIGLCPTESTGDLYRTGLVLETNNLEAIHKDWEKNGVEFLNEPKTAIHGIMVSFKDPSGNILDLYEPTPEKVIEMTNKIKESESCCGNKENCSKKFN